MAQCFLQIRKRKEINTPNFNQLHFSDDSKESNRLIEAETQSMETLKSNNQQKSAGIECERDGRPIESGKRVGHFDKRSAWRWFISLFITQLN